jgi:hypothetical protein
MPRALAGAGQYLCVADIWQYMQERDARDFNSTSAAPHERLARA